MNGRRQLECRIVVRHLLGRVEVGMYDPISGRYEDLGTHPDSELPKVLRGLKASIEQAGHRLTFSELTVAR